MTTELIINATLPETRIALLENGEIQELHIERDSERGIVGNIYKGKVIRVLPGMQACFVDIGLEKAAFLYVDDIFFPEMKTPLEAHPLPEAPKPVPREVVPPPSRVASPGGRVVRGGRGRPGRGEAAKPTVPPAPGTPEAHAMMQREYAKQMLDIEDEAEGGAAPAPGVQPVSPESISQGPPVAAAADPQSQLPLEGQPAARAPQQGGEGADDEEEDIEPAVVYRPEPLIDADAWAEDLAGEEEPADPAASEAGAEGGPEAEAGPGAEAGAPTTAPVVEAEGETPAPEAVAESGVKPKPVVPPVLPLAAPIKAVGPVGVDPEDDEDEEVAEMPRKRRRREPVNIADIVKEGQDIVVQVAKDPIGTKGARLTCHVSLPGRYLVFMPTVDHIGVSRRIESEAERRRLKETMSKIRPSKTGVIVRTASGKQTDRKLKADLDYLVTTWNDIQKKFNKQRTPSAVYQDLTIVLRAIRDMFTDEVDKVVVDSTREHKAIMRFVTRFIPSVKDKVELYSGDMPVFDAYGIETEISRAMERKVWLKSGGYLVVDQAEALVAIDVNTGRYVGKKTLEETILKTNLEAVKEIAYQLRLRNCGGIIILDLIDMEKEANKEKVYKALEEALRKDRARPSILKISQLGLVEMTRKRTRDSMVRALCEPCSYCEGRSFVKNKLTIAYDVMRDIEREGAVKETQAISIQCHPTVADVLLEDKRDVLEDLEHQFGKKITIRGNGAYHVEQYELIAHREAKNIVWSSEERRQQLRQKIQERQQQMASENRKRAEADRRVQAEERKREQEERRRQQEELRAERKAQAEERRLQAEARRAELIAQGIDPSTLPPEEPEPIAAETDEELLGPDGEPLSSGEGDGLPRPGPGGRRRRRRGRRGRGSSTGGRSQGPGQQTGQSRGRFRHDANPKQSPVVSVSPVSPVEPGGSSGREPGADMAVGEPAETGGAAPGGPEQGGMPRRDSRRRRRGRRGGRRRHGRGRPDQAGGTSASSAGGGSNPSDSAPAIASGPSHRSGGGAGHDGGES